MKPSVILYKSLPDDLLSRLQSHFDVTELASIDAESQAKHPELFANAVGLLGSSQNVDAALLEKMPQLRAASTISVGYDNFDVDALTARKVALMHTPTVLTETVADTMMTLVLATARRAVEVAERVKKGEWQKSIGPDWFGIDVHHKTMASSAWDVLAWRWRSARTSVFQCRFCTTHAAITAKPKNVSMRVIAISTPCWRSRISCVWCCR